MKTYQTIKTIIFLLVGALILILNELALEYLPYTIGGVMAMYAIFKIISGIIKKDLFTNEHALFEGLILLIFAFILMFLVNDDLVKVCVIWGTWSILREAFEFAENSESLMHKGPGLCSMIESIVVIVLSITMIAHPSEHHAHVHIFLLGIELILEVVFPLLYLLWYRKHPKHSEE